MSARLTWRNQPSEAGLAVIGQQPRGYIGKVDGNDVARVWAIGGGWSRSLEGWTWSGWDTQGYDRTRIFKTKQEARDAATTYYKTIAKAVQS